jgi:hypothetical protein
METAPRGMGQRTEGGGGPPPTTTTHHPPPPHHSPLTTATCHGHHHPVPPYHRHHAPRRHANAPAARESRSIHSILHSPFPIAHCHCQRLSLPLPRSRLSLSLCSARCSAPTAYMRIINDVLKPKYSQLRSSLPRWALRVLHVPPYDSAAASTSPTPQRCP